MFEENAFQKYLVNRTKVRENKSTLAKVKWQEKDFIEKHTTPTVPTEKIKRKLVEMEEDEEVNLSLYKNFSKSAYFLIRI